jgi:penicillin-binding protein 1A
LELGSKPSDYILDSPIEVEHWRPANFDGKYLGRITLLEALSKSRNAAAVRLMEKVKRSTVIQVARRLGVVSSLLDRPSLALGCSEMSLLEVCAAYSCFSNGGYKVKPYTIEGICDRFGNVEYWHKPVADKVIDPKHIKYMNEMLTAVVSANGTGKRAVLENRWAAGKTGTTQDSRDAWFVGYTRHLLAGIWIGKDDNSPMRNVLGGDLPALAWKEFMKNVYARVEMVAR